MKKVNQKQKFALVTALIAAHGVSPNIHAGSVSIHTVKAGSGRNFTLTEDALLRADRGLGFGLSYDYSNDPLVIMNQARTKEVGKVITDLHTLDAMLKFGFSDRFVVGLGLPIHHSTPFIHSSLQDEKMTLGDMRLFGKMRLNSLENKAQAWAFQLDTTLPTGNSDYYLSDDSVALGGRLIYEVDFSILQVAANAGYLYSGNAEVKSSDLNYTHQFPIGLSLGIPVGQKWAINSEVSSKMTASSSQTPGEFYLGGRYHASENVSVYLGGGMGTLLGEGSMDYRISAGVRASLGREKKEAIDVVKTVTAAPIKQVPAPVAVMKESRIEIGKEINFALNSDRLTAESEQILMEVANLIKENQSNLKKVQISGHTDRTGSDAFNLMLSQRRAAAVKQYLITQGVQEKMVESEGYGEAKTKYSYDPKNRRVEFNVVR